MALVKVDPPHSAPDWLASPNATPQTQTMSNKIRGFGEDERCIMGNRFIGQELHQHLFPDVKHQRSPSWSGGQDSHADGDAGSDALGAGDPRRAG